mgnify:CR=1 FL=1
MPDNRSKKSVSIICPVFNEEDCIPRFFSRLETIVSDLSNQYDFELLFMNNASTDSSLSEILKLREEHNWIDVITLSRNFGYQLSLLCGLNNVLSDAVIIIDVDCEDPPEMIPQFLEKWEEGFDIVYGKRVDRPEPILLKLCRKLFYRLTKTISDNDFILDMAEFSLFTQEVKETLVFNRSSYPFIRTEIAYAGFSRHGIAYRRHERIHGETHYNLIRMSFFAVGGILSSSTFPLRFVVYAGLPLMLINFFILLTLSISTDVLLKLILFNINALLLSAAIFSIYIARVYKDGLQKPLYIINRNKTFKRKNLRNFDDI